MIDKATAVKYNKIIVPCSHSSIDGKVREHLDTIMIQYLVFHPAFWSVCVDLERSDFQTS